MKKYVIIALAAVLVLVSCTRQKQEATTWNENDSLASLTVNDQTGEENLFSDVKEMPVIEEEEQAVNDNPAPPKKEEPSYPEFSTFFQDYQNNGYDLSYLVGKYVFSWEMGYSPEYIEITHNEETQEYEITWYRHVDYILSPGEYDIDENGRSYERDETDWDLRNKGPFETIRGILKHDIDHPYRMHVERSSEDDEFPSDIGKYSFMPKIHSYPNEPIKLGEIVTSSYGDPNGWYHLDSDFSLYQEWKESQKR